MTANQALDLVAKLGKVIDGRRADIDRHLDYYRGRHRLRFASEQFANYFAKRFDKFSDNWCDPVIAAPTERMTVNGIRLGDATQEADADLGRVWQANDADGGSSEAFVVTLATGRSFGLVWGNPDDEQTPRLTWEHPSQCAVGYDPDTGKPIAGLKMWHDGSYDYATLYTDDEVWKWQRMRSESTSGLALALTDVGRWQQRQPASDDTWPLPNPLGEPALFELRNQALLDDDPRSDIKGVSAMQDAVNLLWAYLFNALDFASLPQRVVLGAEMPKLPVLDETGQVIGEKPVDLKRLMADRVLWLPDPEAKLSSWPAAQLDVFSAVIEHCVEHIGSQTRTPPHYLVGKLPQVAAETLTVAETGLVAKTRERITYVTPGVRRGMRLIALAQGDVAKANAVRSGKVLWADPQYRSDAQKFDALIKGRQAGLPLEWMLEWFGLPPAEVERVMSMAEDEAGRDVMSQLAKSFQAPAPVESPAGEA